jgi:hypothetical protein
MSKQETGGPAFPYFGHTGWSTSSGMTLRDYFAAKALAICPMLSTTDKAEWAYKMADAMLKARNGNS